MKYLLSVLFVCSILSVSVAQEGWEAGGWLGTSYYFGDLNTQYNLSKPGLAGGIIARYNFNKRLCLKVSANYGKVMADDADSNNAFEQARNLSFESIILDGAAQFEFNFLPYTHGSQDEFYTPYVFVGLNTFYFNPEAEFEGEMVELRPLGTEGQFRGEEYSTLQAGLVYGIGFKFDLSYEWSMNIELNARYLFTDYLDDVSTVYADKDDLIRERGDLAAALSDRSVIDDINEFQIGVPGRQRGDSNTNDSFVFIGVGLLYYFGDLKCPEYGRY